MERIGRPPGRADLAEYSSTGRDFYAYGAAAEARSPIMRGSREEGTPREEQIL